jgi:hypothetical protein
MKSTPIAAALALLGTALAAQAGEIYGNVGLPGASLGYAQPLSASFGLHADLTTLGDYHIDHTDDSGNRYHGTLKSNRGGLFGNWFVAEGGFRFTGGVTFNDTRADVNSSGIGTRVSINGVSYVLAAGDAMNAQVKYPGTTPYLGIGWGHHQTGQRGWGLLFDLGTSYGRPKTTLSATGPTLGKIPLTDVAAEQAKLQDQVDSSRFLPQFSLGASYKF